MLLRDLVEGSNDAALEQAPDAFDAVRVNVTDNPFLGGVVDGLVAGVGVGNAEIGSKLVGVDGLGLVADCAGNEVVERALADIGDALQSDAPAALDCPGNPRLVALVGPSLPLPFCLAANQRFV